jgi:DNA-binding NarL/FixJ family response regulator
MTYSEVRIINGRDSSGIRDDVVTPLRVVIAEQGVLLREGLASLLEDAGFDVVGQASDGGHLLALVRDKTPDLVVADLRVPQAWSAEGLDTAMAIRDELPDTGIVLLSARVDDIEYAMKLMDSGPGIGYVLKSRITNVVDFIETLERIANGASFVDPALVLELLSARRREGSLAVLSTRERDVLALMAEGRSNVGIGRRLWITEPTVEKHVSNILTKLGLPKTDDGHRRVLAVIAFLDAR